MANHTPNRLEEHWSELVPLLKKTWPLLSDADFEYVQNEFDRLVEAIRQRYGGRAEIIQEAYIREKVNELLRRFDA